MIAHLKGTLAAREANSVVLDVGGVGYRVHVPVSASCLVAPLGEQVALYTVMAVREDAITLYGFAAPTERDLFTMLTSVAGVGPRIGLSMLSVLPAADLARAIARGDTATLTRVPGVGPKLAQRLAYELGDRMEHALPEFAAGEPPGQGAATQPRTLDDAIEALIALGYGRTDARKAAEKAAGEVEGAADAALLVRHALRILSAAGR
ncbi:MAG: Holliday junction branch migration protein RuvA [Chthonomonadales bacterium]